MLLTEYNALSFDSRINFGLCVYRNLKKEALTRELFETERSYLVLFSSINSYIKDDFVLNFEVFDNIRHAYKALFDVNAKNKLFCLRMFYVSSLFDIRFPEMYDDLMDSSLSDLELLWQGIEAKNKSHK